MNQTMRFNEKIYDIETVMLESNDYEDRDVLTIYLEPNFIDKINKVLRPLVIRTRFEHGKILAQALNLTIDRYIKIDSSGLIKEE